MPSSGRDVGLPPWKRRIEAAPAGPKRDEMALAGGFVVRPVSELPLKLRPRRRLDETTDNDYDPLRH